MSKTIRIKKKPVLPFYLCAACWLVCGLLLPLFKLWALALTAVLSIAVFLLGKRFCPDRVITQEVPFMTGSEDADEMLNAVDAQLKKLHELNEIITDAALSESMERMEKAGRGILAEVEHTPGKAKLIRRFASYYLPDAVKILDTYAHMEQVGASGESAAQIRQEVKDNTAEIAAAFENQLDSLYEDTALDISADLEVLQSIMKGQGL